MAKDGIPGDRRKEAEADFFTLMECLGLAAWRGNGRTGTDADFEELRDAHAGDERFRDRDTASLKNVALQIHTRQSAGDDKGFEFIHKSFGEYLAARALLSRAADLSYLMNLPEKWKRLQINEAEAARRWAKVIGPADLTGFVLNFLRNEAKLTPFQGSANEMRTALERVLGLVQQEGMPVQELHGRISYRALETLQRCAESAMLATATAIASGADSDTPGPCLQIPWPMAHSPTAQPTDSTDPEPQAAARMFHRLNVTTGAPLGRALQKLDLSNQNLIAANLIEANLSGACLRGAYLIGADLRRANLIGASLNGANLSGANLREAKLREANLSGADLSRANLSRADLSGADLSGADLRRANLSRANLSRADLRRANLIGADLSGAKLREANLSGADLHGAKLKSVRIQSSDLSFADLTRTLDLTQKQVNAAKGSKRTTKLPEGLTPPDPWSED